MESFCSSSAFTLTEMAGASSSSAAAGVVDDAFEDCCSICLEPFNTQDPATVTSCRHEYHLQCILDWFQRSKECPICWQLFVLRDPASQELLDALDCGRSNRSRNISPSMPTDLQLHSNFDVAEDALYSDDSDFDETMIHQQDASASRVLYDCQGGRQRSPILGYSQLHAFINPDNLPGTQQSCAVPPEEYSSLSCGLYHHDLQTSGAHSSGVETAPTVNSSLNHYADRPRPVKSSLPQSESPRRPSLSEAFSFPDTIKSKFSAASARYKESISKGTRGLKEKLLAQNNTVKELSKGVQREMSAGIAGVARIIERLDIASKRQGCSTPVFNNGGGTPSLLFKGKDAQQSTICQNMSRKSGQVSCDQSLGLPLHDSNIGGQFEVSGIQGGH